MIRIRNPAGFPASLVAVVALAGCASQGGLNISNNQTTGGNTSRKQVVTAMVGGTTSLESAGLATVRTVFVPFQITETGGNGNPVLYINAENFTGDTGSAIPATFVNAQYGYLVAAWQTGGMCRGKRLSSRAHTVFYQVARNGSVMGELKCLDYHAKVIATPTALFYSSPGFGRAHNWDGLQPNGKALQGPQGVSLAIPLPKQSWYVMMPGHHGNVIYYLQTQSGQRQVLARTGPFFYQPAPIAVYVNTPPYQSSQFTGFTLAGFVNGPDATSGGRNTGGAFGAQVLNRKPPVSCYGLIGRACGTSLWYQVSSTLLGNGPDSPAGSAFVWGHTQDRAYIGYFPPLPQLNPFAKNHYVLHRLTSNISYKLPLEESYNSRGFYPRIIITPMATVVVDTNRADRTFGEGFLVNHLNRVKILPKRSLNAFWAKYDIIPPGASTWR